MCVCVCVYTPIYTYIDNGDRSCSCLTYANAKAREYVWGSGTVKREEF